MNSVLFKIFGLMMTMSLVFGVPASFADEGVPASPASNEVVALKSKVDELNQKLADLERKIGNVEGQVREVAKPALEHPGHIVAAPVTEGGLMHVAQDIEMGGYVDTQYNYNTRQPSTAAGAAAGSTNPLRIFDTDDNSFTVNSAEFYFQKVAQEAGDAGFRIDIMHGEDADIVNGDGSGGNKVDLQQAYVEYIAPLSIFEGNSILPDQVGIKAGRFVTLAGAEVIEGADNWNISRSFGFGLGIPFTHTGVRTNFGLFNDYFDVYAGVNNGWDTPVDTNADKTLEAGLGYEPLENVSVFHSFYFGNENADGVAADHRFLWSNVITWDATDKLSFMGNFDLANQNIAANARDSTTAQWYEFAAYARYQFNPKFAMAYRAEIFRDETAVRTAGRDTLFAQTFTAEYKLTESLIARGEFRHDKANDDVLIGSSNSSYATLAAQLIYVI